MRIPTLIYIHDANLKAVQRISDIDHAELQPGETARNIDERGLESGELAFADIDIARLPADEIAPCDIDDAILKALHVAVYNVEYTTLPSNHVAH